MHRLQPQHQARLLHAWHCMRCRLAMIRQRSYAQGSAGSSSSKRRLQVLWQPAQHADSQLPVPCGGRSRRALQQAQGQLACQVRPRMGTCVLRGGSPAYRQRTAWSKPVSQFQANACTTSCLPSTGPCTLPGAWSCPNLGLCLARAWLPLTVCSRGRQIFPPGWRAMESSAERCRACAACGAACAALTGCTAQV